LANLENGLALISDQDVPPDQDDEDHPFVSLHKRALPLLELLRAAIADESYVSWE
jgi:hypothetical protein